MRKSKKYNSYSYDTVHQYGDNFILFVFLGLWLIMNLLQSGLTELAHDEAYYWMYSRHMAWGYFDHPPMTAVFIKIGYSLLANELGVRLLFCLAGTMTLWITYRLCQDSPGLFIILAGGIALMHTHVAGFLAIPDIPLVFFTALFFYLYKKYISKDSIALAVLLGIMVICMLYSKYHGILVVIFVFLSNMSLVRRRSAWIFVAVVTAGMIPHLLWQIHSGFPTFQFHLVSRSDGFDPENIINYLYSQVLIAGPLIAPLVLYYALSKKPVDLFEKALKYTLAGFYIFFFASSFRDHIEAHWTAAAFIPMIVLAHRAISDHKQITRWIFYLGVPSLIAFVVMRILVAFNMVPGFAKHLDEFNGWKNWTYEIREIAAGKPVIFLNKYQYAAKYSFYTGEPSFSMNDIFTRRNQYNLWQMDSAIAGKDVLLVKSNQPQGKIPTPNNRTHGYSVLHKFQQYSRINIAAETVLTDYKAGDSIKVSCVLYNPTTHPVCFDIANSPGADLCYVLMDKKGKLPRAYIRVEDFVCKRMESSSGLSLVFSFKAPARPGEYRLYAALILPSTGPIGEIKPASFRVE